MAEGLQFEFSADTTEYRKAVQSMPKDLQKAADEIEHIGQEINTSMGNAIGRGLVQGLAGAGVALKLRDVISQFDQVADAAKRFGTSAEDIQRVDFAAKAAGSSMESVASAIESAGVRANKAAREGGALADAFNRAGIDAVAFSMADLSERIGMVARAQGAASGDAQQLADITEALGQSVAGVDFASMAEGMRDVNVLSNETVRQLSEANGEIVKFERNVTLLIGSILGGVADVGERIGSIIAKEGALGSVQRALLALTPAAPLSFIGGQTIEEMEQAEEALNGLPPLFERVSTATDGAAESAVNYSGVLSHLVQINAEMEASMARMEKGAGALAAQLTEAELRLSQLSQEFAQSGDADVFKEIEKTAKEILSLRQQTAREEEKIRQETTKTSEEYRKQADAQARAISSLDEEIQMLEAKLSGNTDLTEELQRQKDFREAFQKTGDVQKADAFANLRAQERQQDGQPMTRGGGSLGGLSTHPPSMRDLAAAGNVDAMTAQLRSESVQNRYQDRVNRLLGEGKFRSAAEAMKRASNRAQRDEDRFLGLNYIKEQGMGNNFGEGYGNFRREFGLDTNAIVEKTLGDKFDPTKSAEENFKRMAIEQAKTPQERQQEEEEMRAKHAPKGGGGSDIISQIHTLLTTHLPKIDEKLPQHALA